MDSKEEIRLLREENKFLKETIFALTKRVEELEIIVKEKSIPSFIKKDVKEEPKKSGQKEGHIGCSRHVAEKIDETIEHKLNRCPICKGIVSDTQEIRERVVEDVEQPKIKVTKHLIHRCYCKHCDKIVEPEIYDALPNSRFGLKLMILVLILKLDCRIPSNKITSLLSSVFGVKISDGEIYNILKKLSEAFGDYYEDLIRKIKEALAKHIDETSWRINGKNNWLWIFINKEIALYIVEKQRSSEVPVKILGNQEGKFITTDRYSAYNVLVEKTGCLQQVCWTHLIRNSKDLSEHYREAKYIHKRMKYIYRKAKEGKTSKEKLLLWINLIASRPYTSNQVFKFVKSICRNHREDLFRFIDNPEVNPSNNLAEQGLRPAVVIRKVSGGSRSEDGAEITARLLSVLQTVKLQTNNPYESILNLLQKTE
jgi:transposase-like protein